jgi:hypothetical protein
VFLNSPGISDCPGDNEADAGGLGEGAVPARA